MKRMRGARPLPFLDTTHRIADRPTGIALREHNTSRVEGLAVTDTAVRRRRPIGAVASNVAERAVAPKAYSRIQD